MPKVHEIMTTLGYELRYSSENLSQYISPLKIFGEVDFIHAYRSCSINMLDRAKHHNISGGELTIRVVSVEDVISLNLQAIKNDESRRAIDLSDIEMLLSLKSSEVDWGILQEYFLPFDFDTLYDELRRKYYEIN